MPMSGEPYGPILMGTAQRVLGGECLSAEELSALSAAPTQALMAAARSIRDVGFGSNITYSRKVFIPVTQLCRDVCHYCTFARPPKKAGKPFMSVDEVLSVADDGARSGCREALFTLGEKPELRYSVAADWLKAEEHVSTIAYVAHLCRLVLDRTGLLPHVNAGNLTRGELRLLRPVAASIGLMLESTSEHLGEGGMPHHGSPDKDPAARLATLRLAGEEDIPTTSGILIGIGETWEERVHAIVALRDLHREYGHIQEVIVQNFRAKPGTRMARHSEPTMDDLARTVALARLALGADISIQVPPNLNSGSLQTMIHAGIDDWGGVSPVTPDHVNPEFPWPHVEHLARESDAAGKHLSQRLTIYPAYVARLDRWCDPAMVRPILHAADASGLAREDEWRAGRGVPPPSGVDGLPFAQRGTYGTSVDVDRILEKSASGLRLTVEEIERLFEARGPNVVQVCRAADRLRRQTVGDVVSYVVTRNINYTNVCTYGCRFCAFSKGRTHQDLRGSPYDLTLEEVARRVAEAWDRGATEVCMQGGIHPDYTGRTYLDILRTAKRACPDMHVHAFSPLEVQQGARTLGWSIADYLGALKDEGLGSLPGTAAEILDDEVRAALCPDKLTTNEWLEIVEAAHLAGLRTTATIMFGHIERPIHWARHLSRLRTLQERTGGITEFVPLPFVAQEAPLFLKGRARPGPTWREAVLMHAVARIALHPVIPNIQASWVKLGPAGVQACLKAGVNDLGGTLMNESITRAAGAVFGQEAAPATIEEWINEAGRTVRQRTTLYGDATIERKAASHAARDLAPIVNEPLRRARGQSVQA